MEDVFSVSIFEGSSAGKVLLKPVSDIFCFPFLDSSRMSHTQFALMCACLWK